MGLLIDTDVLILADRGKAALAALAERDPVGAGVR